MDKKIILHIPHSSTHIPLSDGYLVDPITLEKEILKLTDWYTDDLFYSSEEEMIVAEFSRIFCDPERFTDDSQEVMAQYGMGVLYEKSDTGEVNRIVTPELKEKVLTSYYWKHHNKFNTAVNNQLDHYGKVTIIDCHSYPSKPLKRDLDKNPNRPDFNIGTDSFHTTKELIDLSVSFFKKAGYTLGIDWPYTGSIVPLEHYKKNKNVSSIMLEINRALYLNEPTNQKSETYYQIKQIVSEYIQTIKNSI
ncbi:N-formylglutamate amidohydrolase [Nonlabens sp.]|uniref:N-formylglutamate amidohydrolase n=1 Tax=Nonlabens sp. TaxID=1888209 RepID=UPI0025DA9452|nr:N-formylglutamate amidohydrolase [Nonlabens sp.]